MCVKDLYKILVDSAVASAVVMLIVSFAGIFSWAGQSVNVMDKSANFISQHHQPSYSDPHSDEHCTPDFRDVSGCDFHLLRFPADFHPLMEHFGWNSIWFGVLMTVNLAIGQITPPVAVNLYVGANVANITLEEISTPVIPFILAAVAALALLILFRKSVFLCPACWDISNEGAVVVFSCLPGPRPTTAIYTRMLPFYEYGVGS